MAVSMRCPQGHQWELAGGALRPRACPECGAAAVEEPAAQGSTSSYDTATITVKADWPDVPHHEILGILGRGGMGIVYKARHLKLNRLVAVKVVATGADAEQVLRFQTEAEAVGRLQHPHIVQVYEVGEAGGRPYLCLEYIDGVPLDQKLGSVALPPREAAELIETLARAMHYAHERGIIHRDLKPSNILLTQDGTPKISDFGLAKRLEGSSSQTRTGAVMGTPHYMSPEQASGQTQRISPATDVYAFGAILYDLLAGRPPFKGSSVLDTLEMVRSHEPVSPHKINAKIHADLATICLKCLEKEPRHRYASALDLADDLRRYLNGQHVHARPLSRLEQGLRWVKRHPTTTALTALGLSGLLLVGVLWSARRTETDLQAATAETERLKAETRELEEKARELERERAFEFQVPAGLPGLSIPSDNALSAAKIELGKRLFFDKRLSLDNTVACASCHDPAHGWSNGARFATGISQQVGDRSAPTIINAAFQRAFFWDGRAATLEQQALGPIQNPIEMGMTSLPVLEQKLAALDDYRDQFQKVFGSDVTAPNIAKALAAFERTLLSGNAPYDRHVAGVANALSPAAVRGWTLFFNKAHCSACHGGPNFTDDAYHNIGVGMDRPDFDPGRSKVSKLEGDRGSFKTPTLREIARTAPYMHDGSLATLEDVVRYYARGGTPNDYLDEEIYPHDLTDAEISDLATFLKEGLSSAEYPDVRPE